MNENSGMNAEHYRSIAVRVIRQELYPETGYPPKLFPDLVSVLWDCFTRRNGGEFAAAAGQSLDPETIEKLEKKVKDLLEFQSLLGKSPETVVLLYRSYIKRFILYQQSKSSWFKDEWEDIFQEVITRLISGKIHRIREKYDFSYGDGIKKSTFTSYLMVTVRNIYMDIIRERQVRPLTAGELQSVDEAERLIEHEDTDMLNRLVMDEEFRKFRTLLALHYRSRWKLELCLKLKCRIFPSDTDIRRCFPRCSGNDIDILSNDYKSIKDKRLFDMVVDVFNRNEGRENKSDTLRKWISVKVDELIAHMNRGHGGNVYTGKNLVDFITLYYERYQPERSRTVGEGGRG
jgi:DNA-directed RNA polymerase specialized sigma24 family protein